MPKKVELSNNRSATYLYDAAGVKRQVVHQGGRVSKTTDYCGNVIYENGELTKDTSHYRELHRFTIIT